MSEPIRIKAPCSKCVRDTTHIVLFKRTRDDQDFAMIECAGCESLSMRMKDNSFTDHVEYYPSPVSRKEPIWLFFMRIEGEHDEANIGDLMCEVYQALFGGQYRLAAMGIRAALEQAMVTKTGDLGSFRKNLDAFQRAGYISIVQREAVEPVLNVGHAAIHRGFTPTEKDLLIALDVVEGVLAPIFQHIHDAKGLERRVPNRT